MTIKHPPNNAGNVWRNFGSLKVSPLGTPPTTGFGTFDASGTWTLSNYDQSGTTHLGENWAKIVAGDVLRVDTVTGYQQVTVVTNDGETGVGKNAYTTLTVTQDEFSGILEDDQPTGVWLLRSAAVLCTSAAVLCPEPPVAGAVLIGPYQRGVGSSTAGTVDIFIGGGGSNGANKIDLDGNDLLATWLAMGTGDKVILGLDSIGWQQITLTDTPNDFGPFIALTATEDGILCGEEFVVASGDGWVWHVPA